MGKPTMEFVEKRGGCVRRVYWVLDRGTSYVIETTEWLSWYAVQPLIGSERSA